MSIWAQSYRGSQFHDAHDLEILNNTLRTFASPDPDSHTAAKTRHLRKLRDDLPVLRIDTDFASPSLIRSSNARQQHKESQSNQMVLAHSKTPKVSDSSKYDSEITRPGVHAVKFNIDPTHHRHKNDKDDVNSNFDNERSRIKKQKQLRRASAPYHEMAFSYFSASTTTSIHHFGHQNCSESSQGVGNKPNFSIPSVNIEHHDHDHDHSDDINDNSNMAATSPVTSTPGAISSCNVPSLSPCSSASSISSSIDTFNSTVQQQSPPGKVQFSFSSFLPQPVLTPCPIRSKSISTEIPYTSQAHSLPNMVSGASYDNIPWSPAKDFLASLAQATMAKPKPDDEGQQVGEYVIGKEIGRGGFSTVKEAIRMDDYSDLEKVAVKIVKNDQESDCNDRIQSLLQREVTIWKKLDHPNIVPMLSTIEDDYATYTFSEYCPGGTLLQYIKKHGKGRGLDEDEARNIFLEITEAVRYMHNDMRLVHKDIKLDNILLDREDAWKLCDFGLTEFQNDANGFGELSSCDDVAGGSLAYCPPEQIRSKTPLKDPSVDIWSLGVVLYAMVTGQFPFMDGYEPRLQYKILNGKYDETPLHEAGVSDELRDLLKGMFRTKSADRLNITQLLEHVWCRR